MKAGFVDSIVVFRFNFAVGRFRQASENFSLTTLEPAVLIGIQHQFQTLLDPRIGTAFLETIRLYTVSAMLGDSIGPASFLEVVQSSESVIIKAQLFQLV